MMARSRLIGAGGCVLALAGLLGWSGCVSVAGQASDPTSFYLLDHDSPPAEPVAAENPTVGLRRITLPAYLRSARMVVRRSNNEIRYTEFHRWSEALEVGIARVVTNEFQSQWGMVVRTFPYARQVKHTAEIELSVRRMDALPGGRVRIAVDWEVYGPDRSRLASGTFDQQRDVDWTAADFGPVAAGFSDLLAEMAGEIGKSIGQSS